MRTLPDSRPPTRERRKQMSDLMVEVTDINFEEEVVREKKAVLVDFWAPWCGPCQAMGPILAAMAIEFGGQMTFAKCNVDNHPAIARRYSIKSIPTIILFSNGKPVEVITGAVPKNRVAEGITRMLAGEPAGNYFPMA
jgi:thioredoxin 1